MFLGIAFVHWLVILAIAINALGAFSYVRGTLAGTTKPNRVTWSMWALAPLIGAVIAFSSGADPWTTARVFSAGFLPLIIFLASFVNKNSYWKLTVFDVLCGVWSFAAIIVWLMADSATVGILFAVIADAFAGLPTLRKAWQYPETENGLTYAMSFLSVILVLPSVPVWNVQNCGFQVYLLIINVLLLVAIYRKRIRL